jgi:hypothetical protein
MTLFGIRLIPLIAVGMLTSLPSAIGQSLDTPMTRLRPIGAPSAVDRYRGPAESPIYRETAYQQAGVGRTEVRQVGTTGNYGSEVRQAVMQQQFAAPQLPATSPGSFTLPPTTSPSLPPNSVVMPQTAPRGLPTNQAVPANGNLIPVPQNRSVLVPSRSDLAPLAQPELGNSFATIDNCNCVSAPSDYSAASVIGGCAPVSYQAPGYQEPGAYTAAPTVIAAPAIVPNGIASPQVGGAPAGALLSFGQETYPVLVGQGWLGQPVAYVPGQPIRNWIRYIFP